MYHKAMLHTKFQAAEPGEDFLSIFYLDRIILYKFGKGPLDNATYQISIFQPRGSEEQDFGMLFFVFLCFKPRTSLGRAIFNRGTFI